MDSEAAKRLESYFGEIGEELGNDSRRQSFAIYAMGILEDGERKSVEPIAARACADPAKADAAHQSLLHFRSVSTRLSHGQIDIYEQTDGMVPLSPGRTALAA
jgi:SRSO17 transposase